MQTPPSPQSIDIEHKPSEPRLKHVPSHEQPVPVLQTPPFVQSNKDEQVGPLLQVNRSHKQDPSQVHC